MIGHRVPDTGSNKGQRSISVTAMIMKNDASNKDPKNMMMTSNVNAKMKLLSLSTNSDSLKTV